MEKLKLAYRIVKAFAYLLWTSVLNLCFALLSGFCSGVRVLLPVGASVVGLFLLSIFTLFFLPFIFDAPDSFDHPLEVAFSLMENPKTYKTLILITLAFLSILSLIDFVKYEWDVLKNFKQLIRKAVCEYRNRNDTYRYEIWMKQREAEYRRSVLATEPIRRNSIQKRNKSNFTKLLKQELSKVVGHELAKKLILSVVPKHVYGEAKRKPVSFLFVGKTGVGKTELVKRVAEALKGDGYKFFRIDANQLRTPESTQTLFGSPRGYLGSDSVPLFIQEVKESGGKMVILIDEIEKAHPSFIQAFMTLLDEGEITYTPTGERMKLNNAFVFITSNLEADRIAEETSKYSSDAEKLLACKRLLEDKFPPEILGRINYVIPFENLSREQFVEVIQHKLAEVKLPSDRETAEKLFSYFEKEGILKRGVREAVNTIEALAVLPDEFKRIVGPTIHVKS